MLGQGATKAPIKAFVNENTHCEDLHGFQHFEFAGFDHCNRLLAFYCWISFEEIVYRLPAFQTVDEVLQGHASTHKYGRPAHNLRIRMNYSLETLRIHHCRIYHMHSVSRLCTRLFDHGLRGLVELVELG